MYREERVLIKVENLTKKYGSSKALDNVSFEIEKGHIYGLLGPNGAGKSTTMNIITGYISASSGTVTIDGHDIVKEPQAARKLIGYLPELPPLYMDMTVYEYLKFVAELKKVKRKDRAAQIVSVMEQMSIASQADRLIKNLSKGYRQRVGFAQALIGNPQVLILDEPSVGLDPKQIIDMRNLIAQLGKEHTVILSSHILQEISAVCDYLMIINRGKLIASGTKSELLELSENGSIIEIMADCTKEDAQQIADKFEGIHSCDIKVEDEICNIDIVMEKDAKDIRKQLFKEFSDRKIELINLNLKEVSLEEVFLELVTKSDEEETKEQDLEGEDE